MEQIFILKEPIGKVTKAVDIFGKIQKIEIDYTQENFILICMNSKNQIVNSDILFKGGLNSCVVDPKTIFRKAIKSNANCFIIAHNHPSGCLEPSQEDEEIFKRLKDGGEILSIKALDSIIFNKDNFYSMNGG